MPSSAELRALAAQFAAPKDAYPEFMTPPKEPPKSLEVSIGALESAVAALNLPAKTAKKLWSKLTQATREEPEVAPEHKAPPTGATVAPPSPQTNSGPPPPPPALADGEQLTKEHANKLFASGDVAGAMAAYECLLESVADDHARLPLLANLGACHLKNGGQWGDPKHSKLALPYLEEALRLRRACYANPRLATKVAARLVEVYDGPISIDFEIVPCKVVNDPASRRRAVAELRFHVSYPGGNVKGLKTPRPTEDKYLYDLVHALGTADPTLHQNGLEGVKHALNYAPVEEVAPTRERFHGLAAAVKVASTPMKSSLQPPPEKWGKQLLELLLKTKPPVDARFQNGRTTLMLASCVGRPDLCALLLGAHADPSMIDDKGFTALHTACVELRGGGKAKLDGVKETARLLLKHGAPPNAPTLTEARETPLLMCIRQAKDAGEGEVAELCGLLLDGGADPLRPVEGAGAAAGAGMNAYDVAASLLGRDSPVTRALAEAAAYKVSEASLSQRQVIGEYAALFHGKLAPAREAALAAVEEGARTEEEGGGGAAAAMASATVAATRRYDAMLVECLAKMAGMTAAEAYSTGGGGGSGGKEECGLRRMRDAVVCALPRVLCKSWPSAEAVDEEERAELRMLLGPDRSDVDDGELVMVPPDVGATHVVAGCGMLTSYIACVQSPLQRTFAFATPSDAALAALARHAPICEVGAGAGYWGALLRARGVECTLYDRCPLPMRADEVPAAQNAFHNGTAFTEVLPGGPDEAARHTSSTLLLVWPFSQAMMVGAGEAATAADGTPWDLATLRCYQGDTVAHVGGLTPSDVGLTTTSEPFIHELKGAFELAETVALDSWPLTNDALTVWKRIRRN